MPHSRCTVTGTSQIRPPLDEGLEAAELDDMQADLMDVVVLVEQDRHLAVAFDAGHRFDRDAAQLLRRLARFRELAIGGSPQS